MAGPDVRDTGVDRAGPTGWPQGSPPDAAPEAGPTGWAHSTQARWFGGDCARGLPRRHVWWRAATGIRQMPLRGKN